MAESIFKAALRLGYIDEVQKAKAEKYKMETGLSEDSVIRDTKIISDEAIVKLYSDVYHIPIGEIKEIKDTSLMQRLNPKDMHRLFFFPVKEKEDIVIYTSLPSNLLYAEDLLKETFGFKGSFIHKLISLKGLNTYIAKVFEGTGEVLEDFDIEGEDILNNSVYDIAEEDSSAVVNLINKILRDAISKKTSDVHFEPQSDELIIRFREDGTLYEYMKLPLSVSRQVLNRIKTMSALDVNISKTIQDGNCRLEIFGKTVDLRISVIPAVNGENIVIRILDQNKMSLDISMLGFSKENEELFKKLIRRPQGMILLTGPTGSGKSTSLYAAVSELNTKDRCIITFEDPVEYRVPGIVQVQINHSMNVTFPQALKSGLRQDIEVALVGEIRDEETASIAFDAANTGHMVFSTLHTNSAASSIIRLTKMGIEPYIISRSLVAVINQRLVKRICENCKEEYFLEENSPYRKILGCGSHPMTMFRGKGCSECNGTGYKGRVAVQEFLVLNEEIEELLDKGASTHEIELAAIKNGMKKIHTDGIEKAIKGITTLDEIHRCVFFDEL